MLLKISFDKEMVNIDVWVDSFTCKLKSVFENRIEFIGLQGSYAETNGLGGAERMTEMGRRGP